MNQVYYTGGRVAAEQRAFEVDGDSTSVEISAYPLCGLGMAAFAIHNSICLVDQIASAMENKRIAPGALTANTQRATPTTLAEIADLERGYLRASKAYLQPPR
jgi:hypothetical protein